MAVASEPEAAIASTTRIGPPSTETAYRSSPCSRIAEARREVRKDDELARRSTGADVVFWQARAVTTRRLTGRGDRKGCHPGRPAPPDVGYQLPEDGRSVDGASIVLRLHGHVAIALHETAQRLRSDARVFDHSRVDDDGCLTRRRDADGHARATHGRARPVDGEAGADLFAEVAAPRRHFEPGHRRCDLINARAAGRG